MIGEEKREKEGDQNDRWALIERSANQIRISQQRLIRERKSGDRKGEMCFRRLLIVILPIFLPFFSKIITNRNLLQERDIFQGQELR